MPPITHESGLKAEKNMGEHENTGIRKRLVLILLVTCVIISLQPISHTSPAYLNIDYGFFQDSVDYGPLSFTPSMLASQIYFNSNYSCFTDLRESGETYRWSLLGMRCSPNGNITLTNLSGNEIELEVNGPTGTTTTVKSIFSGRDTPENVTGVDSWSYNESNDTLTFYVTHSSPANVMISFATTEVTITNEFPLEFFGFIILASAAMYIGWTRKVPTESLWAYFFSLIFWIATMYQWHIDNGTTYPAFLYLFFFPILVLVFFIYEEATKYYEESMQGYKRDPFG